MSVEKNQLFKVGDRVKILPTILSAYPNFPYVGVVGRVCVVSGINIGVKFSTPCDYLHNCNGAAEFHSGWWCLRGIWNLYLMIICQIFGSILNKSEVLLEFN